MNDVEVYVVVEGQTEQTFIRDVLAPEMSHQGIYLHPALIGKPGHKGGDIHFDRAQTDIGNFLRQRPDTCVSTMFDYFRIDANWPGRSDMSQRTNSGSTLTPGQKAEILETAMQQAIEQTYPNLNSRERFIPYIEMHEFEALLFSDAQTLAEKADIKVADIHSILKEHGEPEAIDDNPDKAPSKQLLTLNSSYLKVATGTAVAKSIGIPSIRKKCSHFNQWLTKLEELAH